MAQKMQPFPWYGAKRKWLDFLLPRLPHTERYVEPFCGSATTLLSRHPSGIEALNDIDNRIYSFFKCLRERPEELIESLRLTPYHESEYMEARESEAAELTELERARKFFIQSTIAYNSVGSSSGFGYSTREVRRGMPQHTSRFISKVEGLEEVVERIREVQVFNRDASELVGIFDSPETLFYVDPPYPLSERTTGYEHEFTEAQHRELASTLTNAEGYVAVSSYQNSLYDELFSEWGVELSEEKGTASTNTDTERVEALYVNYEVPSGGFAPPKQELTDIPGVGERKEEVLRSEHGIESPEELLEAAREQQLREISGFTENTERKFVELLG